MKTKPEATPRHGVEPSRNGVAEPAPDVMTLDEAAAWLRVTPAALSHEVESGRFPGHKFGLEWRLSRFAMQDVLRRPVAAPLQFSMPPWYEHSEAELQDDLALFRYVKESFGRFGEFQDLAK
jgi:hypothetical protein